MFGFGICMKVEGVKIGNVVFQVVGGGGLFGDRRRELSNLAWRALTSCSGGISGEDAAMRNSVSWRVGIM
jgi:hypothetical protein